MINRKIEQGARVMEKSTGVYGTVKRCLWLVDMKTNTPALAACIVWFGDGRRLRCTEDELVRVKAVTFID